MSNTSTPRPIMTLMELVMGIGEVEKKTIAAEPRLLEELWFQFLALVLVTPVLGFSLFKTTITLISSPLTGFGLAFMVALVLGLLNRHFIIQARGDRSGMARRGMLKVRFVSVILITSSFVLSAGDILRQEIDELLAETKAARRAELEQSDRFKNELLIAKEAVNLARQDLLRAQQLHDRVAQLKVDRARAFEDAKNELEGNVSANGVIRQAGPGPRERGAHASAARLGMELEAAKDDLARLGDPKVRLEAAQRQLAQINGDLDDEAAKSVGGGSHKLDGLFLILERSWTAVILMTILFFLGLVPDLMMWFAQSRMANHELWATMRQLQDEVILARLSTVRRQLRQEQANGLAPVEIRLTPNHKPRVGQPDGKAQDGGQTP